MKHRIIQGILITFLLSLFVILMVPGDGALAYISSPTGNPYSSSLYGGYGLYGSMYGGLYGSSMYGGLYGSSMYGGLYGSSMYGGLYGGMYGGLYGSSMYGGLYGSMYGGLYGGMYGGLYGSMYGGLYGSSMYGGLYGSSMYGGLYGSSMYGGLYGGMYGGYGGALSLGLSNLMNPLPYYSYGGMYNLLGTFDPLGDPLLGFGMLSVI